MKTQTTTCQLAIVTLRATLAIYDASNAPRRNAAIVATHGSSKGHTRCSGVLGFRRKRP